MIVNQSSLQRGFGHGTIYKTKVCDLEEGRKNRSSKTVSKLFGFAPEGLVTADSKAILDDDGLPRIGSLLKNGDVIAAWHTVSFDTSTGTYINRDGMVRFPKVSCSKS
jgi:DNA-directed RNA polymerase I subunit RPA2